MSVSAIHRVLGVCVWVCTDRIHIQHANKQIVNVEPVFCHFWIVVVTHIDAAVSLFRLTAMAFFFDYCSAVLIISDIVRVGKTWKIIMIHFDFFSGIFCTTFSCFVPLSSNNGNGKVQSLQMFEHFPFLHDFDVDQFEFSPIMLYSNNEITLNLKQFCRLGHS